MNTPQQTALSLLLRAGYVATASDDGHSVTVQDPVIVLETSENPRRIEHKAVVLRVNSSLSEVFRFINVRS